MWRHAGKGKWTKKYTLSTTTVGYQWHPAPSAGQQARLACDYDADAVIEAGGDIGFTDDVLARVAVGVCHVVQRPRHAQGAGPTLGLGIS